MQEQQYELNNIPSFNSKHIFECGQCFRWDEESDGSYTGIVGKNVINVKQVENRVKFSSYGADNLNKIQINKEPGSIAGSPWGAIKGERIVEWLKK